METKKSKALREKWYKMLKQDHVPEWDDRETFTAWAEKEANGREYGLALRRFNPDKPFGPDNCYLQDLAGGQIGGQTDADIIKWNKTVNVFRRAAGLPLFKED